MRSILGFLAAGLVMVGCGGYSIRENLAVGEFVGDLQSIPEGSFEMFMDLEFRRSGRVEGWGKIEPDVYLNVSGEIGEDGLLELVAIEDESRAMHVVSGFIGVERVTMSGQVERRFNGEKFASRLELVRIDPL